VSIVICKDGRPHLWELPHAQFTKRPWVFGSERTLCELAAAIASTGREVELRGELSREVVEEICEAAGAWPTLDPNPRRLTPDDIVILPEGWWDASWVLKFIMGPARAIVMALAPPGLQGWPFTGAWSRPDPFSVPLDSVGRLEHYRAMAALGLELWTNSPRIAEEAQAAGVDCVFIGWGTPVPFPDPPPKRYDLVTVLENRWAPLSASVAGELNGISHRAIPKVGHAEMLRELGSGRVLAWPSRIEGQSRIQLEARAMGTVPVALSSNRYAAGLGEENGAVLVDSVEEMPEQINRLLSDRRRLSQLAERAVRTAREQADWGAYVDRVDGALRRSPPADWSRPARVEIGRALEEAAREEVSRLQGEIQELREKVTWLESELRALRNRRSVRAALSVADLARPWFALRERRARRESVSGSGSKAPRRRPT
jgi:hypothetical protein